MPDKRQDIQIPLRDRSGKTVAYATISPEDSHLAELRWHRHTAKSGSLYVRRDVRIPAKPGEPKTRKRRVYLHREIMGTPAGMEVDHLDGDTMNNTRGNLEQITKPENLRRMNARRLTIVVPAREPADEYDGGF